MGVVSLLYDWFLLFLWSIWFVWLNYTYQINETNQINQINLPACRLFVNVSRGVPQKAAAASSDNH